MKAFAKHIIPLLSVVMAIAPLYAGNENKGQTTVPAGQNPTKGHNHDDIPVNSAHIDDFSIAPGQTMSLTVWMNNTFIWHRAKIQITLPEGLEIEQINPDILDSTAFTLGYMSFDDETRNFVALSREFTDPRYVDEQYLSDLENEQTNYNYPLETFVEIQYSFSDHTAYTIITNDIVTEHRGEYPLTQYRIRATEELADISTITTRVVYTGNIGQLYEDPYSANALNGTPTVCHVRRVDALKINADVNGDGRVDIDDVNAVIKKMVHK